jgi:hypothetical protein
MRKILYFILLFTFSIALAQGPGKAAPVSGKLEEQKDEDLVDESKPEVEGKPFLFVIPFQSELLTKLENDQASKLMLQVGSKQLDYKLVLSSLEDFKGIKRKVVSVTLEIVKVGQNMKVRAVMKDISTGVKLRFRERNRVSKRSLIREINIVLELLFMSEDEIKEQELKKQREKKFKKRFSGSTTVPDNGLAAFKLRILGLKKNIKNKFEKLEDESKDEEGDEGEDETQTAIVKKKKKEEDPDDGSLLQKRVWVYFDSITAGILNQNTNTAKSFVAGTPILLNTSVPYLSATYSKGVYLDVEQNYYALGSIGIGQTMTDLKEENAKITGNVDMYMDITASAGINFSSIKAMIDGGVRVESLNYINVLDGTGTGLQPLTNNVILIQLGVTKKIAFYNRELLARLILKIPVMTMSSDDSITDGGGFTGTGFGFSFKAPSIYWNWLNLEFTMESSRYTVANIYEETIDSTMIGFKGYYDF